MTPCVLCGVVLKNIFGKERDPWAAPAGGSIAQIKGNYGSTVFDPSEPVHLELIVCDTCLTKAALDGKVEMVRTVRRDPERTISPWNPSDTEW